MILVMTNLNPTEANTTSTGITKVGTVTRPSQVADTEARVVTPKDIVEEINMARRKVVTPKDMAARPKAAMVLTKAVDTGLEAAALVVAVVTNMDPAGTLAVMQAVVTPKGNMAMEVVNTERRTRVPKANRQDLVAAS